MGRPRGFFATGRRKRRTEIAYGVAAELAASALDRLAAPAPKLRPTERTTIVEPGILATPDDGGMPFTTAAAAV
ncbi:MAG: hypothetical protein KIT84_05310 [Labilithrix sp.]|nr:hypothetical protein [Labilithrix sp.]MCW5810405.1 hypothetical protein [Labilithrix sp.]